METMTALCSLFPQGAGKMAFSKTPEQSTYRTVPIKFDAMPLYRSGDLTIQRDCNIVNLFYDRISQENKTREVYLKKRPGMQDTAYNLSKADVGDNLRGFYYDIASNQMYWAVNDKVYSVSPDDAVTVRTVCTLNTSTGDVGFCEFLRVSDSKRLVLIADRLDLWVDDFTTSTCTEVVDADLPSPHVPVPVQLDGYVFLAAEDTGDLYNSENDDPTSWVPGDFITCEMSGDYITHVAQMRNYVVAFGTNSIEMFWDAANTEGTPLKRHDAGYKTVGFITGFCQIGDIIYFVGQDKNKLIGVYMLDGFKLLRISDEIVDRTLQPITASDNIKAPVNLGRSGYSISTDGHTFYVVVADNTTWAYDIDEKLWYEWKNPVGTGLKIEASWPMLNGAQYVAINNREFVSLMSPALYQDFDSTYTCTYTTERFDGDSVNQKVCNKLSIRADTHRTSGTSNLTLTWSDDDWYSTKGTRSINLFTVIPRTFQLGQFRTRSFRLSYRANYPLRIRGLELEINIGTN